MANTQAPVSVENLIDGAILEGFQLGARAFLESLEDQLQSSVIISEAGDAQTLLQAMLNEAETSSTQQLSQEHLEELGSKLSRVLK